MVASKTKRKSTPLPHKYLERIEEEGVIREIEQSNDRSVGIVCAGFIENALSLMLLLRFRPLEITEQHNLFSLENGCLSTFHAKIQMADALNLFGPNVISDMRVIKKIRNLFAHKLDVTNFSHPEVAKEVDKLIYPKWLTSPAGEGWDKQWRDGAENKRVWVERTTFHLIAKMNFETLLAYPAPTVREPTYDLWHPT